MTPPNPRRFVPTLTEVVEATAVGQEPPALYPPTGPIAAQPPIHPPARPLDKEAAVAEITAVVSQQLDDLIRNAVTTQLQAQHLLLVQHLRNELMQSVQQLVVEAVKEHLSQMDHSQSKSTHHSG